MKRTPPPVCPVCGEDVPPRSLACPECGACHESGWSDDAVYDNADLPDEDFDYDEFTAREFEGRKPRRKNHALWWITAAVVLAALLWMLIRGILIF